MSGDIVEVSIEETSVDVSTPVDTSVEIPYFVDDEYIARDHNCEKVDDQTISFSGGNIVKKIIKKGTGDYPVPASFVSCHYTGWLAATNEKFDSSVDRDEPFQFKLGERKVIKAWEIGIASMRVGEKAIFNCKSDFCYGKVGSGEKIPEDSDLIFEIELLGFERGAKKVRNGLNKLYLQRGWGKECPTHGTVCNIRIEGRIGAEDGQLFLNEWEESLLVRIDDSYVPKGIEYALCSMKPGEISVFEVEPHLIGNGFEPVRHIQPFPPGMNVYYRIQLVDMELLPQTWNMKPMDKVHEATRLKNAGNDFFRSEQYDRAFTRYKNALDYFEYDDVKDLKGQELEEVNGIKVICLNNMQVVNIKDKEYLDAIDNAKACLEIDPKHIKSIYRLGQSLIFTHDTADGIAELQRGLKMIEDGEINTTERIIKDLNKMLVYGEAKKKRETSQTKRMWNKAFANIEIADSPKVETKVEVEATVEVKETEDEEVEEEKPETPRPRSTGIRFDNDITDLKSLRLNTFESE